jgi:hypothetical protein
VIFLKNNRTILLIISLFVVLLFGCNRENTQTEYKPKDKAPRSLRELSAGIDDILNKVDEIEKLNLNIPSKEQQQQSQVNPSSQSESNRQNGTSGSDGGDGGSNQGERSNDESQGESGQQQQQTGKQQKPLSKEEMIKNSWDGMQLKLEGIHTNWNNYEAEGMKKGLTQEASDKFETSLNSLTKAVENKNIIEIYDSASNSYLNLKPFYDLYQDEISGDIYTIRYAANQAYLKAVQGDLEGAINLLNGREENINKIRLKQEEDEDPERVEKISLSLADFRKALEENSRHLFMIKKDVILENLRNVED